MPGIVLLMQRRPIAQGIMREMGEHPHPQVGYESDYAMAEIIIKSQSADTALIEVAESGKYDMHYCLDLCNKLRRQSPECKLVLLCPEQDKICVAQAVDAKRDRRIDDFVFYDSSIDYMTSKLLSM